MSNKHISTESEAKDYLEKHHILQLFEVNFYLYYIFLFIL